ncbi:hypothetical protein [Kitasatospora sp. NPDC057500]
MGRQKDGAQVLARLAELSPDTVVGHPLLDTVTLDALTEVAVV